MKQWRMLLPYEVHSALKAEAARREISMGALVRLAIDKLLKRLKA